MTVFSAMLAVMALFLLAVGMAGLGAMLKGCFVLRRLARSTPGFDAGPLMRSPLVPAVSVIVTPTDASPESRDWVRRLLGLAFANLEVVVALDGRPGTDLETWIQEFHLSRSARGHGVYESQDPLSLVVVDAVEKRERGWPADALNAGVQAASASVIALVDLECEFDSKLLVNLIRPMLEDPAGTIAVCGRMSPPAGFAGLAAAFGALESLRSWLARGAALAGWGFVVPVPGSSLLVRREAIRSAGGFRGDPHDLLLDLHALSQGSGDSGIAFVAESASFARGPRSWADLHRRISKDQAQFAAALRKRGASGAGALRWGLPALFLVRGVRPVLETAALAGAGAGWMVGWIDPALAVLVLLCTVGVGICLSMAAAILPELAALRRSDPATLAGGFLATIPENLGYRQVRNLWLISGWFHAP